MKRIFYFIFSFLLFFNTFLFAQEVVWQKKMLQSSWTIGYSIKQTTDGNYIVCGLYDNFSGFVSKINSQGDTIWVTICPARLYSIVEAIDGNYLAIGWSSITKISPNGQIIWHKPMSETGGDLFCFSISKTNDDNFIVAGRFEQLNPRVNFGYVIKFDNNGNKIWSKLYGSRYSYQGLNHVKEIDGGNFIAAGGLYLGGNTQVLLMKLNNTGDLIWQRTYGTNYTEYAMSVFQLPDKSYLTIGTIKYSFVMDLYFIKTDSSGNFISSKIYGDTNIAIFTINSSDCAVEDTFNNSYVITGIKDTLSFLLAIDQNAEKVWEKTYGLDSFEVTGYSVDVSNDSGYIVCGYVFDTPFNDSNPQYLYALKTTKPKVIGINNYENHLPPFLKLLQNYPNPFNNETIIKYEISKPVKISIVVYNILGEKIQSLINKNHGPGIYSFVFDAKNYASGIYFVEISDDFGNYDVRKMIIIK